jgi:hypothetical protein
MHAPCPYPWGHDHRPAAKINQNAPPEGERNMISMQTSNLHADHVSITLGSCILIYLGRGLYGHGTCRQSRYSQCLGNGITTMHVQPKTNNHELPMTGQFIENAMIQFGGLALNSAVQRRNFA